MTTCRQPPRRWRLTTPPTQQLPCQPPVRTTTSTCPLKPCRSRLRSHPPTPSSTATERANQLRPLHMQWHVVRFSPRGGARLARVDIFWAVGGGWRLRRVVRAVIATTKARRPGEVVLTVVVGVGQRVRAGALCVGHDIVDDILHLEDVHVLALPDRPQRSPQRG